jgi:protein TonB
MFDYAFKEPQRDGKPRYMTTMVSAAVHIAVLAFAIGLPILYASDALPEPPDMMAFVVDAPPPPPPPPPPAPPPPAAKKAEAPKPNATEVPVEKPAPAPKADTVAAPTEAPAEVKPETGNEGNMATGKPAVEAGFEKGVAGGIEGGVAGGIVSATPPPPPPPPPPPAPPKPQGPVRVGGKIKSPSLVNRVNPVYPPVAQAAQVEGAVVLEATVGKDGRVDAVRVVNGSPLLNAAATEAVKQWRYEPLLLNGEPVPFVLTVTVSFKMPR